MSQKLDTEFPNTPETILAAIFEQRKADAVEFARTSDDLLEILETDPNAQETLDEFVRTWKQVSEELNMFKRPDYDRFLDSMTAYSDEGTIMGFCSGVLTRYIKEVNFHISSRSGLNFFVTFIRNCKLSPTQRELLLRDTGHRVSEEIRYNEGTWYHFNPDAEMMRDLGL
ncbi:MAG: hypothetical protein UT34_C0002G0190 [candidate division WS6 bacterium GW2011_GWF2_39_15]|uniref:Uncharacterized protein n=1 Tax=candidate division WS6 bacterium GW2011_GWF2_39_15 TaxID=1619100 RepID=A0A0G0MRC2_9BACT|nr:MAG: hypothetical protein UT34_C0002G0190 [candidate division WS6 bacterium GW2011_GWF2_39_15]